LVGEIDSTLRRIVQMKPLGETLVCMEGENTQRGAHLPGEPDKSAVKRTGEITFAAWLLRDALRQHHSAAKSVEDAVQEHFRSL